MIIKKIWKDPSAVGRLEYLRNWLLVILLQLPFALPGKIADYYDSIDQSFSNGVVMLCALLSLIGAVLGLCLIIKNIFKRARDLEGSKINKWKWALLGVLPIVSLFGQAYLLLKPGKAYVRKPAKKRKKS